MRLCAPEVPGELLQRRVQRPELFLQLSAGPALLRQLLLQLAPGRLSLGVARGTPPLVLLLRAAPGSSPRAIEAGWPGELALCGVFGPRLSPRRSGPGFQGLEDLWAQGRTSRSR